MSDIDNDDELWTPKQYRQYRKISRQTEERERKNGSGPPYIRFAAQQSRYRKSAVLAHEAARTFKHLAEERAGKTGDAGEVA